MPDICMCQDTGCSLRTQCYRFTATPSEYRQTYYAISPRPPGTDACRAFLRDYRIAVQAVPTFTQVWDAPADPQYEDDDEEFPQDDNDDASDDDDFDHDEDDLFDDGPLPEGILP